MSARIVFFASIRESLGVPGVDIEIDRPCSLPDLIENILKQHDPGWRAVLTAENTRVAVNQELIAGNLLINDGDEVAFFPPVTGG